VVLVSFLGLLVGLVCVFLFRFVYGYSYSMLVIVGYLFCDGLVNVLCCQ